MASWTDEERKEFILEHWERYPVSRVQYLSGKQERWPHPAESTLWQMARMAEFIQLAPENAPDIRRGGDRFVLVRGPGEVSRPYRSLYTALSSLMRELNFADER